MAKIPALTMSGGKLSEFGGAPAVKEYRVWVHPKKSGDDYFYTYSSYQEAIEDMPKLKSEGYAEKPLAVVWDKKYNKYREVVVDKSSTLKSQIKSSIKLNKPMKIGLDIAKETKVWS